MNLEIHMLSDRSTSSVASVFLYANPTLILIFTTHEASLNKVCLVIVHAFVRFQFLTLIIQLVYS